MHSEMGPVRQNPISADNTYTIVPATNSDTVQAWTENNNLKLNFSNSKEIV